MAQAVWHAAHESTRPGGTASAAFHAFRPEMLEYLGRPRRRPAREVLILGAHHVNNLGREGAAYYDQPRTTQMRILLEDYTDTYGRTERRLAAYRLDASGSLERRIGYLPKDAPRQEGIYVANLYRRVNQQGKHGRIEGTLTPVQEHQDEQSPLQRT